MAALLQEVMNLSTSQIYVIDLEGRYLFANRRVESRLGMPPGGCVGRSREEFFPPGSPVIAEYRRNDLEVIRRRAPITFEETNEEAGGTRTDLSVKYPLIDSSGEVYAVAGISTDITERKRLETSLRDTEAVLREREMHLQAILDAAPECVKTFDREGRLVSMNAAGLAMIEVDSFDIVKGMKLAERLMPPHRAAYEELIAAVFRGESRRLEYEATTLTGKRLWLETHAVPLRDPAEPGEVKLLVSIARDISAYKCAMTALERSRDDLAHAEIMTLLGHYRLEKGATAFTCSEGVYRIMRRSRAAFTATLSSVLELFHPEDRPVIEANRRVLFAGGEPPPVTLRMTRGDGEMIHVLVCSKPLRDDDGAIVGMFGTIQDVTARVRAEAAAMEEARFEQLRRPIAHAPVAMAMFDRDMRYLSCSQRWLAEHGFGGCDPTGRSAYEVFGEIPERWREADRRALAGEVVRVEEDRWQRSDGVIVWLRWEIRPWHDAAGEIGGIVIYSEDITARKQAEAQSLRLQEELHQAQKMEAVGRLTDGLAHDFNNLLAVILGSLELIGESVVRGTSAEQELVEAALRAGRRGQELVQRLLAFSRKMPLRSDPANLDQLVLDTLRLLQRTLGEAIEIDVSLNVGPSTVLVDRGRLASALVNLALNARDAMPEGGRLTIATGRRPASTDGQDRSPAASEEVWLAVTDTGRGMNEDVQRRSIEPFFTTKPEGTGLGLGMVAEFAEQAGGSLEISSVVGNGTTVIIRLPLIPVAAACPVPSEDQPAATSSRRRNVLLVEDDSDVRAVTAARLKRLGYQVRAAADGDEAIAAIESPETIDVMLTDIVLRGGIDGISLVKEALRVRPRMGMLCMSGYAPSERNIRWLRAQNVRLLEKPFSGGQLAEALRELEL